jgi:hypothetical protein
MFFQGLIAGLKSAQPGGIKNACYMFGFLPGFHCTSELDMLSFLRKAFKSIIEIRKKYKIL